MAIVSVLVLAVAVVVASVVGAVVGIIVCYSAVVQYGPKSPLHSWLRFMLKQSGSIWS